MSGHRRVAAGLADLEALDRTELGERWTSLMKRPAPKAASRVFLLRALSYELQSQHAPDLSKSDQKALALCLKGAGSSSDQVHERSLPAGASTRSLQLKPRTVLVPGSRLVREWNGHPYTVSVIEEGFVYKDRTWTSLSAIAKDITGAHWSGPRFFGLHKATA